MTDSLPMWALEVMMACARSASHQAFMSEIEAMMNERLFQEEKDEAWYAHFPQHFRARSRELTLPDSWEAIDDAAVEAVFAAEGSGLARIFKTYEPRAGQTAMAHEVARALNLRTHLLAEAGTGVGKSLAYLVPCALWAMKNNLPIVISTNTRNLQSQLLTKDLPLVARCLAGNSTQGRALNAVVLKGRSNYLCLKHFGAFIEGGFEKLTEREAIIFADLVAWAAKTTDGDMDTFRPKYSRGDLSFVHSFGCHSGYCTGKTCRFYKRCFLQRARQAALMADLIIVNHALVFAELMNPGTLLPPHAQIVFDEAHNLENAATSALSVELSPVALYDICQKIAPSKGREANSLYQQIRLEFIDKAIKDNAERARITDMLATLRKHGLDLATGGKLLFATLAQFFSAAPATTTTIRYRSVIDETLPKTEDDEPQLRREVAMDGRLFRAAETFVPEAEISEGLNKVLRALGNASLLLERFQGEIVRYKPADGEDNPYEDVLATIKATYDLLSAFGVELSNLLRGANAEHVYWMTRSTMDIHAVVLTSAPLDVAVQLNRLLYDHKESIIFSSATLRTRTDFNHVRSRLGLNLIKESEKITEFVAESPFNYPQQCCVTVPDYLPEVSTGPDYILELSRLMYQLFVTANGRSLALFTSYEMLKACADQLEPYLKARGIDLLAQSATLSRDAMTEAFREQKRPTVLLGTQSFWEGVDVIGDALSCVIIARLPFETVGDPLFKARCEQIESRGHSSFLELSVPQAVIKFRQGFGRLIRSRSDRGMVVVADTRISRKQYGMNFANSLPVKVEPIQTRQQIVARLKEMLGDAKR